MRKIEKNKSWFLRGKKLKYSLRIMLYIHKKKNVNILWDQRCKFVRKKLKYSWYFIFYCHGITSLYFARFNLSSMTTLCCFFSEMYDFTTLFSENIQVFYLYILSFFLWIPPPLQASYSSLFQPTLALKQRRTLPSLNKCYIFSQLLIVQKVLKVEQSGRKRLVKDNRKCVGVQKKSQKVLWKDVTGGKVL